MLLQKNPSNQNNCGPSCCKLRRNTAITQHVDFNSGLLNRLLQTFVSNATNFSFQTVQTCIEAKLHFGKFDCTLWNWNVI